MSEQAYQRHENQTDARAQSGMIAVATHWTGAIVSFGLIVGLGVWGYKLTMRDVTEVPVIRAMEGPLRIQPKDPGGEIAAYQGLAVNEVQANGTVESPPDKVTLAPAPVALAASDTVDDPVTDSVVALAVPAARVAVVPAQSINLTEVVANSQDTAAAQEATAQEINAAVAAVVLHNVPSLDAAQLAKMPGVKRSRRPRARAIRVAAIVSTTSASDASPAMVAPLATGGSIDVNPAEVKSGTRMVQLGAFDNRAAAIREWTYIIGRHGDLIGARKRLIQKAESGGRSFYRLRMVGFNNLGDSRRLCSALMARGTPCIPVTAR